MARTIIKTKKAPQPMQNLFSQAIKANGIVFLQGCASRDPETGKVMGDTIEEQIARTFDNVATLLDAAGSSLANAVQVVCYLQTREHFPALNTTFARYFPKDPPTRAVLIVPEFGLPGMMFEAIVTATEN
jgi:2-iminobutanoate/2-iminopropanoate deaminase